MEHPIALPYGEPTGAGDKAASFGAWIVCALVVVCSAALIWLCFCAVGICIETIGAPCGTPIVTATFQLAVAPVPLSLPFIKLLWAKRLPSIGRVARCFLTGGLGVWAATMLFLLFGGVV